MKQLQTPIMIGLNKLRNSTNEEFEDGELIDDVDTIGNCC
jgi:hypothetical protein